MIVNGTTTTTGTTTYNVKTIRVSRGNLKQQECFTCRVETEDGFVTLTEAKARYENSNDPRL